MSERNYVLPWKRGIGNECYKIWDANGRLVATVETCADSTFLVNSINKCVALEAKLEAMDRALRAVEWQPIHDPDTHELLGQVCLWCHRKPHSIHCERQKALAAT